MKTDDIIQRSILIITEYYQNNLEPLFSSISDDVFWLGPAQRQQMQGKENMIKTWATEEHQLTFTMGSIKALCISPHAHVKEVLLRYGIYTHFPSGYTDWHEQRLHFTWREKRVKTESGWEYIPEIVMIHISNQWIYDNRDSIYPVHYEAIVTPQHLPPELESHVTVKADDTSVHRIISSSITYIETIKRSSKLRLHTKTDTITVNGTLPAFEAKYPDLFLRIHASYIVNPAHVVEIRRFSVTLTDGTELPVPEKKYTQIKRLILREGDIG